MSTYLPPEVQAGLDAARRLARRKASRLRVELGEESYKVLRAWDGGFAVEAGTTPHLRGRVALYDGTRLLSHCLIIASEEEGDELRFEYKRITDVHDEQPLDFYRAPDAPIALLGPVRDA